MWLLPSVLILLIAATAVAAATPIMLASLGEALTEHSGVQNLGIEGLMLIGALTAFWASVHLGTPWAGVIAAVVVAGGVGLVYASLTVSLGTDQVVTGLALNILAAGLTSYLGRALVGLPPRASFGSVPIPGLSHIPVLGPVFFHQTIFTYASYLMVPALTLALFHTRWGLHLRAVGESPGTADAAGLSVVGFRYAATILGAALVGMAGANISTAVANAWTDNLTGGRGWIALALVIFAGWQPVRVMLGAYLFGVVETLAFHAQALGLPISSYLLQTLPYLFTAAVLALSGGRAIRLRLGAPAALGQSWFRE